MLEATPSTVREDTSEVLPVVALIGLDKKSTSTTITCLMLSLSDLQGYVDHDLSLSLPLLASPSLDLGLCRLDLHHRKFFVFYVANPISGIRARSMRRCFVRVEHNMIVGI